MLLSVVVVCVGWVAVTFSLDGLDGMFSHVNVGKGQGSTEKALAEVALLQRNLSQLQLAAA